MSKKWYRIDSPTPSYDNPIPRDSLEYMKDRLLGTLERPEIIDRLGDMALGLSNVAQMLEPMGPPELDGEELGDSHDDPDWIHKDMIPFIGHDRFTVSGKQLSHMPTQKAKIGEFLDNNEYTGVYSDIYDSVKFSSPIQVEGVENGGFCHVGFFCVDDVGDRDFYVICRPVVALANWRLTCMNIAALSHEVTHAYDYVMNPVVGTSPKDEREILSRELRAYAVSRCLERHLLYKERLELNYPSISSQVERVREELNGPITSEGAFDVHDDLISRLEQEGLDLIHK